MDVLGWPLRVVERLPLRTSSALAAAGLTALEAAGTAMLFLRKAGRERAVLARERGELTVDQVFHQMLRGPLDPALPSRFGNAMQVIDADGRILAATEGLQHGPPLSRIVPPRSRTQIERRLPGRRRTRRGRGTGDRMLLATRIPAEVTHHQHGKAPLMIYLAFPRIPWFGSRRLAAATAVASMAASATVFAIVYRSTVRVLAPMAGIRDEFAEITATDLARRVPVPEPEELKAMAETMNTTLARLETAVSDLRKLTSEASHDLRGPLTSIHLRLENALDEPEADWPRVAADILASVERQEAIVTDLLTLTRLDTGQPLHPQRTDLGALVAAELRRREPTDRIRIVGKLAQRVELDCDRLLVDRLLANLLDNAQRHADGHIEVTLSVETPPGGPATAVLAVADDGDGVPADRQEEIFERFIRLDGSRERDPNGTGLGLPISRDIARAHHGTLTVDSRPGHGARFTARFPLLRGGGDEAGLVRGDH
ncbi:sensor histidine kinase [Actinomadura violacea]|uniref:histidine kinase n=1 Tax=Actinomadura violacea TaxID=2819934 RepID=A0ABS3S6V4_9ACTN|nr:HAMP domain-containing sensor histidine kinase [Actinomadura violacea]MBO2463930.1 HAMP domain-containing histidine kinase [Actinomadura violacea]